MGKGTKPPPPPDTSRYSNEAYAQGQMAKEWAQEMWDTGQQEWQRLRDWSQEVGGASLPAMEEAFDWARDQRQNYDRYVQPAIESLFTEAEQYASKEEEQRQRAQAIQDVNAASEAQREAQLRKLEGYGIDPSETRYQALDKQAGIAQGAAQALAGNQAGERTKQIGRDLRAQGIDVGQRAAQMGQQSQQLAANTGNQAINTMTGATVGGAQVAQGAIPYLGTSLNANNSAAGIVDREYGRDIDYADAQNRANQMTFDNWMSVGESVGQMGNPFSADGGEIVAPGGPTDDAGAIAISDGEYVIPADVVRRLGTNHFEKMIEKETGRPPPQKKTAIPIDPNNGQQMGMARPQGTQAGVLR